MVILRQVLTFTTQILSLGHQIQGGSSSRQGFFINPFCFAFSWTLEDFKSLKVLRVSIFFNVNFGLGGYPPWVWALRVISILFGVESLCTHAVLQISALTYFTQFFYFVWFTYRLMKIKLYLKSRLLRNMNIYIYNTLCLD